MPVDVYYRKKLRHTKKVLDTIVYIGSGMEIAIAAIVLTTNFGLGSPKSLLIPVEYAVTIIVVLTAVVGSLFLWLKHYEKILYNFAMFRRQTQGMLSLANNLQQIDTKFKYHRSNHITSLKNLFSRSPKWKHY